MIKYKKLSCLPHQSGKLKKEAIIQFLVVYLLGIMVFSSFISAGLGMKWTSESVQVKEGESVCLNSKIIL